MYYAGVGGDGVVGWGWWYDDYIIIIIEKPMAAKTTSLTWAAVEIINQKTFRTKARRP